MEQVSRQERLSRQDRDKVVTGYVVTNRNCAWQEEVMMRSKVKRAVAIALVLLALIVLAGAIGYTSGAMDAKEIVSSEEDVG